jgi:dCTP deaminase
MLGDSAIREAIARGYITISGLTDNAIQPASVDLRLGETLYIQRSDGSFLEHNLRTRGPYKMFFGDFILGATYEWITLSPTKNGPQTETGHVVGEMVGKSSRAREAIIVEAAGHFDPGWDGYGTLEISNRGRTPVVLTYMMPICQMRFHYVDGKVLRPYGHEELGSHYQLAMGPELSFTQQGAKIHPGSETENTAEAEPQPEPSAALASASDQPPE